MTREEFLKTYKTNLRHTFQWAKDPVKLGRYMESVVNTLNGANSWMCDGEALRISWVSLGGKGKVTLKALRALKADGVTSEVKDGGDDNGEV